MAPQGIFLTSKGDVRKCLLKSETLTKESITALFKKKTIPKEIGTYEYGSTILTLFGYTEGKAGTENKHELPPPHDETLYFGDILLIACKKGKTWTNPISFTPDEYEKFYEKQFGGFHETDSNSDDDESESDIDINIAEEPEQDIEKEIEDSILAGAKKKTQAEDADGEEDDLDGDIDEAEEEEGEAEEETVLEEEGEVGEDYGEDDAGVIQKAKPKKKTAKSSRQNLTVQSNTWRAKQQLLCSKPGFTELEYDANRPIPTEDGTENRIRSKILHSLNTLLKSLFTPENLVLLEKIILDKTFQEADKKFVVKHFDNPLFTSLYTTIARRLVVNLDPNSYAKNTELYEKVQQGSLSLEHLRTMTIQDLQPHLYTELRDRQLLREQHLLEGNKAMATDIFECNRCHKRQCTYYQLQTRSADEPMTTFITCLNCGKRWRK